MLFRSRYGRAVTRAVLGHSSRRTPTDHYVHVPIEQVAEVLAEYEATSAAGTEHPSSRSSQWGSTIEPLELPRGVCWPASLCSRSDREYDLAYDAVLDRALRGRRSSSES